MTKKGLFNRRKLSKLSLVQAEILDLYTKDFLTPVKIGVRRQTTRQAVYKVLGKLRKKGFLTLHERGVDKLGMAWQPLRKFGVNRHGVRLHGEKFNIRILFGDIRYTRLRENAPKIRIDDNTILLYNRVVVVHSGQSFFAEDAVRSTQRAVEYWNKFLARLENRLKITLMKPRVDNINRYAAHYAEINNELARQANVDSEKIKVYTRDDGKLWFMIDNSFNLYEAETLHGRTAERDMQDVVRPFFNDLRENSPPVLSEVWSILEVMVKDQSSYRADIKAHVAAIKTMSVVLTKLEKTVNGKRK